MKMIPVSDKFAMVDDEDYPILSRFKWRIHTGKHTTYARSSISYEDSNDDTKAIFMHRLIMGCKNKMIDHKDGNGLNNQKSNIRYASCAENVYNSKLGRIVGAALDKRHNVWNSFISFNNKKYNIGTFKTQEEAAEARDKAAIVFHGDFASLNYPEKDYIFDKEEFKKQIEKNHLHNKNPIRAGVKINKYKGVGFIKRIKRFRATLNINGKPTYLGSYPTEIEAAKVWDKKCFEIYGKKEYLNFPDECHQ